MSDATPGIYHLLLRLRRPADLRIGRLGRFNFPAGWYVYTGSAMGGLAARLARHRSRRKRLRWHIDYLLQVAEIASVVIVPTRRKIECIRNRRLLALTEARIIVPRFGSSDCRCPSHLLYFPSPPNPPQEWLTGTRISRPGLFSLKAHSLGNAGQCNPPNHRPTITTRTI
jgi:Uri superfamily endonuclease